MAVTLFELYGRARDRLRQAAVETPDIDARLLLEHFTGATQLDLITNRQRPVDEARTVALEKAVDRRADGEPVHRILGYRDFYGMRLKLSPGTLEPRPDTETLVDIVLPYLKRLTAQGVSPRILDLGTGTGAIALALLRELPQATAIGVDISEDALAAARDNARAQNCGSRFEARRSDWFDAVSEKFHAIVSNPPYIRTETIQTLSREVRDYDPLKALDGGPNGLDAYRVIATQSANYLERDAILAIELGYDQLDVATQLFSEAGFTPRETGVDLAGHPRALLFSKG